MDSSQVIQVFKEAGALLEGHFILSSGVHSALFFQKAHVFMHADKTEILCRTLAEKIQHNMKGKIDYLVGPAMGGIIPAYETSRHLGVPSIWVEREDGVFCLRRFELMPGARVVIVEDIVTTGLSANETCVCLRNAGAEILAIACIIDRSAGKAKLDVPLLALAEYFVPTYLPENLPAELAAIPAVRFGSRKTGHHS